MYKAYVYGEEVTILDFHMTKRLGMKYAKVRIISTGWVESVPISVIEIK